MRTLIFVLACLVLVIPCKAETIIVDPNGFGDFDNIQDAINYSLDGDVIKVRPGDYNEPFYFNNRAVTVTSIDPNDPNVVDMTVIDAQVTFDFLEDSNSVLTGFTLSELYLSCYGTSPTITKNNITNCYLKGNYGATPTISYNTMTLQQIQTCHGTIRYNTFENTRLEGCNGVISDNNVVDGVIDDCDGTISNNIIAKSLFRYCDGNILNNIIKNGGGLKECNATISGNRIAENSAANGAGLYKCNGSITSNYIARNHANGSAAKGGGLYQCIGTIADNIIIDNVADDAGRPGYSNYGGGLFECSGTIRNNIIAGNWAVEGGGLHSCSGSIINNTIVGNWSSDGAGGLTYCDAIVKNNVIAYNKRGIYGTCENNYNALWGNGINFGDGAYGREGDISVNPFLAVDGYWDANDNWVGGDYHLKSEEGRWDANSESWVLDDVNSLCIDAGDPNSDWSAEFWPHGKRINMGAYGGTPQASMSASDLGNVADLNTDDFVGYRDMMLFTDKWLYETVLLAEDLNRDSLVNFTDFAIFAENWQLSRQASNPHPYNGARDVDMNAALSWTAGVDATSHDVYFGTSHTPAASEFQGNQTATTFDPCTIAYNTTYYWRIDEVGPYGKTTGTVWSFTTMGLEASNPHPADGATDIDINADLSWTADVDATSHDVYFGTNPAPGPDEFQRNQTETTFDPGTIAYHTTYYWRIDEVGPYGKTTGTVWSFTTEWGPPPL